MKNVEASEKRMNTAPLNVIPMSCFDVKRSIDKYWREYKYSPSLKDLCEMSHVTSVSHMHYILQRLEKEKWIIPRIKGVSRNIVPIWIAQSVIFEGRSSKDI